MTNIEMMKDCEWLGNVIGCTNLGEYSFVEYKGSKYDNDGRHLEGEYEDESSYKPFVNGQGFNTYYHNLDHAMVGVISMKYEGGGTRADEYQVSSTSGSRVSVLPGACACAPASSRAT